MADLIQQIADPVHVQKLMKEAQEIIDNPEDKPEAEITALKEIVKKLEDQLHKIT